MKTAISIPDDLFEQADKLARSTGQTRSRLYSRAIREYLARHSSDEVTAALDRVCAEDEGNREFLSEATRRTMLGEEW